MTTTKKDPYRSLEKRVHALLNTGDRDALLKKSDAALVALCRSSSTYLFLSPPERIEPYVESWRWNPPREGEYVVTSWSTARNGRRYLRSDVVKAASKDAAARSVKASLHARGRRLVVIWSTSQSVALRPIGKKAA